MLIYGPERTAGWMKSETGGGLTMEGSVGEGEDLEMDRETMQRCWDGGDVMCSILQSSLVCVFSSLSLRELNTANSKNTWKLMKQMKTSSI